VVSLIALRGLWGGVKRLCFEWSSALPALMHLGQRPGRGILEWIAVCVSAVGCAVDGLSLLGRRFERSQFTRKPIMRNVAARSAV